MDQATIRIPATSANLGPGFDCLGVALRLYSHVTVRRSAPGPAHAMAEAAAEAFFQAAGLPPFDFSWSIEGDIPRSRGLGSSVAVRLGILHGLNRLAGGILSAPALYRICAHLEGHPDNAAPAAFGGFAAARPDGLFFRCEVSANLHFVALVPSAEIETDASRGALPGEIPHADAVRSATNAAMITAAFSSGDYELLRGSMSDWLHQPYRAAGLPHLFPAVAAGVGAGALGGYLSGSGSTVVCPTLADPGPVAAALQAVLPGAEVRVLAADNEGTVTEG